MKLDKHLNFQILPPIAINEQLQTIYKDANCNQKIARKECKIQKVMLKKCESKIPQSNESFQAKTFKMESNSKQCL